MPTAFHEFIKLIFNRNHNPPKARIMMQRVTNLWKSSCSFRNDKGAGSPCTEIHAKGASKAPPGKTKTKYPIVLRNGRMRAASKNLDRKIAKINPM